MRVTPDPGMNSEDSFENDLMNTVTQDDVIKQMTGGASGIFSRFCKRRNYTVDGQGNACLSGHVIR